MSVVVCTRNRPHLLTDAVRAVTASLRPGDELIVVDSSSSPPVPGADVRVEDPGLSRARNAGIMHASAGNIVAFTDDDCVVDPGWVAAVADAFVDDRVGVITGRIRGGDDAPSDDPGPSAFRFGATADVATLGAGANMAFRREALEALEAGFDERLGAGTRLRSGEDHDAIWRALRAGWLGRYCPDAVVEHRAWRTRAETVRMRWGYGIGAGAVAAKVAKVDAHTGRRMLWRRGWTYGLAQAALDARRGYEAAAVGDVLYAAGAVVGAAIVWRTPLTRGLLREGREAG